MACVHVSKKNPNRASATPHEPLIPSPLLPPFPPGPKELSSRTGGEWLRGQNLPRLPIRGYASFLV